MIIMNGPPNDGGLDKTCTLNVKVCGLPLEPTPSKAELKDKLKVVLSAEVMLTIIGQSDNKVLFLLARGNGEGFKKWKVLYLLRHLYTAVLCQASTDLYYRHSFSTQLHT